VASREGGGSVMGERDNGRLGVRGVRNGSWA
jgi:hypothetical protein